MEAVATDAGRLVGVGSGRAIGMGRFEVTAFVIDSAA
jgi:CRISPR/Cas system endoribonuclease Cas6 (RAMP superfamily)